MSAIQDLVVRIRHLHQWTPPLPDPDRQFADFAARTGYPLPSDMQEFYRLCGSAVLHDGAFTLLPPDGWKLVSEAIYGDPDDGCPDAWYAFCDARDGDWVAIVLARDDTTPAKNILDCNHEDLTPANIIACSFTEFLTRALDAGDETYWLGVGFHAYGTMTYEESESYWRRVDAGFWKSLGPEVGPLTCGEPGCPRLCISHSSRCRRHHYEMMRHMPCPFDDDEAASQPSVAVHLDDAITSG